MRRTRVVHVDDRIAGAVYIGGEVSRRGLQASAWANPCHSDAVHPRHVVLAKYAASFGCGRRRALLADLPALRGKALACWCRHEGQVRRVDNLCHGDVLVTLLETFSDDELRAMGQQASCSAPLPPVPT
jgi:hypothetical protein